MALLENKLTLITGAAQGLGYATALGMAREGAHVIAADLDTERLGALVQAVACKPRPSTSRTATQ